MLNNPNSVLSKHLLKNAPPYNSNKTVNFDEVRN